MVWIGGFIAGIGVGQFVGLLVWGYSEKRRWQRDLVARGLAYYDPETREWKWKEPTK